MKKQILFTLLGGAILWIWQFISFAMPNFHEKAMQYTPLQDSLLQAIAATGLTEGQYILGSPDPELMKDQAKMETVFKEKYEGKPWAVLNYQMNNSMAMGMNMLRGFITCMVIGWMLFSLLGQLKNDSLINRLFVSTSIGFISFLYVPYTNFIWFKEPDIMAYLLDGIAPWLIIGFIGHKMLGSNA